LSEFYQPLIVGLTPRDIRHHYDVKKKLPAHDKVIRPLLSASLGAFVFGLKSDSELLKINNDILVKDRGKYKLDKSKECITGHEYLWNATAWKRGSIILILKKDFKFDEIFKDCYTPGIVSTPNSGNSLSATKKCKEEVEKGNIGICFPASNGIEWIQIYTDIKHRDKLFGIAYKNCQERDWE